MTGTLAAALALVVAAIALGAPASTPRAACAGEVRSPALEPPGDVPLPAATVLIGPAPSGSERVADDPAAEPDADTPDSDGGVPGALPASGGAGLDAPRSTRVPHPSTPAGGAASRAPLPAVQPPRG